MQAYGRPAAVIAILFLGGLGIRTLWLANSLYRVLWCLGLLLVVCLVLAALLRGTWPRRVALGLAVLALALGVLEAVGIANFPPQVVRTPAYIVEDPELGYAPRANTTATARKDPIYEVSYQFDSHALRQHSDTPSKAPRVLFYGGSFIFGEGVQNQETLPAQFEALSQGRFQAQNFGFHGYGPHQMLASLQAKREDSELPTPYVVYGALLPSHISRCAGKTVWDFAGPRYEWTPQGVVHRGPFMRPWRSRLKTLLGRSYFYRRYLFSFPRPGDPEQEWRNYVGVLEATHNLVQQRYNAEFVILLWGDGPGSAEYYHKPLTERGLKVLRVDQILEDFATNSDYRIHPADGHPSALAHQRVAEYLVKEFSP